MSELTEEKKAQNRIYIVESYGGQYEDKWERTIGVFSTYDKALEAAKETCEDYFIDEDKLPMTFDEYIRFNYGYPDYPKDGYDVFDEEQCAYYNTAIDRDGHTKDEFELMDEIEFMMSEDFTGCRIESYVVDCVGDDKDKISVWVSKDIEGKWQIS